MNGFFICLVFLSHTVVYDVPYGETESWLVARVIPGQLIVTSFFFFSGYGIMYSIRAKGQAYVRSILLSRFPKLLLMLDVAVVLTGGLHYCLGIRYNCEQWLGSLVGWSGMGHWFICMTLIAYLVIWVAFTLVRENRTLAVILFGFLLSLVVILILTQKSSLWGDTVLCIPIGMLFCLYRERIESFLNSMPVPVWVPGCLLFIAGAALYACCHEVAAYFPLALPDVCIKAVGSICYILGLVLVFGCISFRRLSPVMVWLGGVALFPVYITHRWPLMLGHSLGLNMYPFTYLMACCIAVPILAVFYMAVFRRVYGLISRK